MILWINLVTNGLPALALGVDPPDPTQMREPPRTRTSGLLCGARLARHGRSWGRGWAGAAMIAYLAPFRRRTTR